MEAGAERSSVDPPATSDAVRDDPSPTPNRPWLADALAIIAITCLFLGVGFGLAWPWLRQKSAENFLVNRYQPLAHGDATTRVLLDSNGQAQAWTSDNSIAIPAWDILGSRVPQAIADQVVAYLPELANDGHYPAGTSLFRSHSRTLNRQGVASSSDGYLLRRAGGDELIGLVLSGVADPLIYDPPLRLPAITSNPKTEVENGVLAGIFTYTLATTLSERVQVTTAFGAWQDCRQFKTDYALSNARGIAGEERTLSSYCAGYGMVEQVSLDAAGENSSRSIGLFDLEIAPFDILSELLPPIQPLSATTSTLSSLDSWQLNRIAHAAPTGTVTSLSIAPIYVATSSPFVLAATRSGPLLALDAQMQNMPLWEFYTAGSIFSPPLIDADTGRIYFGSSDKHLYALTTDGIFLWRVPMNDNIAAHPLLAQGSVIAVAENGLVYALDSQSGALRWQYALNSASVSAPARIATPQGDLIALASDEGLITVVQNADGEVLWQAEVDGAIQASLVVDNATLFVTTAKGNLYAFASDGAQLWSAEVIAGTSTAPTLDSVQLYLVDSHGWLYAFDRDNGDMLWRSEQAIYVGPPMPVTTTNEAGTDQAEAIIAISWAGEVSAYTPQGELLHRWQPIEDAATPLGINVSLGPTLGGGAIWFGDDRGSIYRLGPPLSTP